MLGAEAGPVEVFLVWLPESRENMLVDAIVVVVAGLVLVVEMVIFVPDGDCLVLVGKVAVARCFWVVG